MGSQEIYERAANFGVVHEISNYVTAGSNLPSTSAQVRESEELSGNPLERYCFGTALTKA
jgi:hypothetical protein